MNKMFDNEQVSVIIPVYNSEKHINETIESVLAQSYKNIEVILVDDCSTDASADIIRKYCNEYSNIVYHIQETNGGASVARNTALEIAKGRYAAFLDSDDLWKPEKIQKQILLMKREITPISYTAIEMIDENNNIIKKKRNLVERIDYKFLLKNTMLATSTVVIDRKKLGDFRMPLIRSGQDYATWLMLLRGGAVAHGIDEALVQYRVSLGSLSSNKFKSIAQVWRIQTKNEGINKCKALINVFCFCLNAFKKYIF